MLCRSGPARASSSAAFPKQQLGERSRIVVAAQFALRVRPSIYPHFLLKNLHFLLKNLHFPLKNVDFLLENVDFITISSETVGCSMILSILIDVCGSVLCYQYYVANIVVEFLCETVRDRRLRAGVAEGAQKGRLHQVRF